MYFFIEYEKLLKNIMIFGIKVVAVWKKNLIDNPSTMKDIWKLKEKCFGDEATDLDHDEIPKLGSSYTFLAIILVDFVLRKHEDYYLQVFLKECKYI